MRHIILVSGKDSLATALVQTARHPDFPYEYVFTDVGTELPETYQWLDLIEKKKGWSIQRVGLDLRAKIRSLNGFLPSRQARYCTRECKIEPMEAMIGSDPCTIYYGLRADETRTGYVPLGKRNIQPAYPLREAGIDLQGVFSILDAASLMPPDFFWKRLYDSVCERMSSHGEWERVITRLERRVLFAGRSRANCFFCFFQRRYELLWLSETHPDLFAEMKSMEKEDYCWRHTFPLRKLDDPAIRERMFNRRVDEVCGIIYRKLQGGLFDEPTDNEISLVSCGLLCGK